jgi:hypothetical protein
MEKSLKMAQFSPFGFQQAYLLNERIIKGSPNSDSVIF